jgi:hypothetical protein
MHRTLLAATRLCLAAFLVGGLAVAAGQAIGIATGSGLLVETFGTSIADTACVIAGIAGILAFLLLYTREGKGGAHTEDD